ncbi:uncharacterized protein METZ01_LOCUS394129 [marine metagenome]|uniref:Uncharacterized protein n=1 Tax=marine metagenome TaxID=408172 RepID=A0A382V5H5_9ZZZZ
MNPMYNQNLPPTMRNSEEMKAWDTKHNCVDVVYSLEEQ